MGGIPGAEEEHRGGAPYPAKGIGENFLGKEMNSGGYRKVSQVN